MLYQTIHPAPVRVQQRTGKAWVLLYQIIQIAVIFHTPSCINSYSNATACTGASGTAPAWYTTAMHASGGTAAPIAGHHGHEIQRDTSDTPRPKRNPAHGPGWGSFTIYRSPFTVHLFSEHHTTAPMRLEYPSLEKSCRSTLHATSAWMTPAPAAVPYPSKP